MFEKDCVTCKYRMRSDEQHPCDTCMEHELDHSRITKYKNWQPSDLYTAYLQEKERADKYSGYIANWRKKYAELANVAWTMRDKAERFRQALNCPECGGTSALPIYVNANGLCTCPACAETRKEAKGE